MQQRGRLLETSHLAHLQQCAICRSPLYPIAQTAARGAGSCPPHTVGATISDVLQEIHIRLVGAPELLVQGVNLADFAQAAVLQDRRGLGRTAVDRL